MSDFSKRRGANPAQLQQDVESSLARLKTSVLGESDAYTPATPGDWASPPPTTVREALDRLAAVAGSPP